MVKYSKDVEGGKVAKVMLAAGQRNSAVQLAGSGGWRAGLTMACLRGSHAGPGQSAERRHTGQPWVHQPTGGAARMRARVHMHQLGRIGSGLPGGLFLLRDWPA